MGTSRRRVVVLGAGGHARVCLDALDDDAGNEIVGCLSADGHAVDGLSAPVIGLSADLAAIVREHRCTAAFVAIGDIETRVRVHGEIATLGLDTPTAVSRYAMVSRRADIGAGTLVCAGAVVNAGARVGAGAVVNTSASVDHDCRIGDFTHIAPGAVLGGDVVVGARVFVALGARVLPRITIGDGAVIGAGAVVIRDVPADATVVGVPARVR